MADGTSTLSKNPVVLAGETGHATPVAVYAVNGASGGTSAVDEAAFTPGASSGTPMMGDVNPGDTPADGKFAVVALDSARNLKVNVVAGGAGGGAVTVANAADVVEGALADAAVVTDANGTLSGKLRGLIVIMLRMFALGTPVRIDPTGGTVQPVSGTVTANLGTIGAAATAAKQPALGTAGTASADVISIQGIASMTKLLVTPDSVALPANQSCNVAQINGVTPLMGAGVTGTGSPRVTIATDQANLPVVGPTASGASLTVNPLTIGGLAKTALPAAVSDAQVVNTMLDKYGRLITIPQAPRDLIGTQTTTIAASTAETTIVTAAASIFNDLVLVTVANTSGTATRVDFRDDTAGSVIFSLYVPAGQTVGFAPQVPLPQTAVNKNWTATCITSLTDLRIFVEFVKNR